MTFTVELDQSVNLNCDIEYRVKLTSDLSEKAIFSVGSSPGKVLDQALLDALLENKLGPLVTP